MKRSFLFIHQNFPGQFIHVAGQLAQDGHDVVALGIAGREVSGVRYIRYNVQAAGDRTKVALALDFETKVIRGLACAKAMETLKVEGFVPDLIVGHPGWGETLFCKDVWPAVRLMVFAEFFYNPTGADYAFDPEFSRDTPLARARLRIKNTVHLHALSAADCGYSPTHWQHRQLPPEYRDKVRVVFDGIDTQVAAPDENAFVTLAGKQLKLTRKNEVITFVNRNLEPYRGFHLFMRALPEILRERPKAHCIIVGNDEVSYGSPAPGGGSWRTRMLKEVGHLLPANRVHFVGSLPYADYLRVLQVSSCHVYLTYPFVLSWSCLEAMSAGCAVVAGRTPPVEEVIEHGRDGLLVDFFDTAALVSQVVLVLGHRSEAAALGEAARRRVIERYDLFTRCLPVLTALLMDESSRRA